MAEPNSHDWISAYLDGELPPSEVAVAERRLKTDFSAREQLQSLTDVGELLQSFPKYSSPNGFSESVLKRCERESLLPPTTAVVAEPTRSPSAVKSWGVWTASLLTTAAVLFLAARLVITPPKTPNALGPDSVTSPETPARTEAQNNRKKEAADSIAFNNRPEKRRFQQENPLAAKTASRRLNGNEDRFGNMRLEKSRSSARSAIGKIESTPMTSGFGGGARDLTAKPLEGSTLSDAIRIGDVIPYLEVTGDRTAVIEVTVIDVNKSVGQFEVLLSTQHVSPVFQSARKQAGGIRSQTNALKRDADAAMTAENDRELIAVYVESTQVQMAEVMRELQRKTGSIHINLKPPVSFETIQLAEIGDTPPAKTKNGKQSASPLTLASAVTVARRMVAVQKRQDFPRDGGKGNAGGNKPDAKRGTADEAKATAGPSKPAVADKPSGKSAAPRADSSEKHRFAARTSSSAQSFRMRLKLAKKSSGRQNSSVASAAGSSPPSNGPRVSAGDDNRNESPDENKEFLLPTAPLRVIFLFRKQPKITNPAVKKPANS